MKDSEFYRSPEGWPQPPDESETLKAAAPATTAPKKQKKGGSAKVRKKMSESLAGVAAAAVAVVVLANSIPGLFPGGLGLGTGESCPVCSRMNCAYYSPKEGMTGLRLSLDGDPVYTDNLDIYDMSGFSHADEEGREFAGSVRPEDGSRMLCIFERDLSELLGPGCSWFAFEDNCRLWSAPLPAVVGRFYTVSDEKSGEKHFFYAGILYMPDGGYPDEIPMVLPAYYPPHDSEDVVMEVVTVEHTPNYYVIAVTDMGNAVARDLIGYVTALPVTTTERTYPFGKTMMLAEFPYMHRTFDDYISSNTSSRHDIMPGTEEEIHFLEMDFFTKSYGIDISTWGSAEIMFASVSWMEVLDTWEELNENALKSGHEVYFHTHRSMDDLEVNGITYHEFAVYTEHPEDVGYYEVWYYYVPAQEDTIAFIVNDRISHEGMAHLIETNGLVVQSGLVEYVLKQITLA